MEYTLYSYVNSRLIFSIMRPLFPFFYQLESTDCAPSCHRMIAKYYGCNYSVQYLCEQAFIMCEGVLVGNQRCCRAYRVLNDRGGSSAGIIVDRSSLVLKANKIPENQTFQIKDVCFSYDCADRNYAFEHICKEKQLIY